MGRDPREQKRGTGEREGRGKKANIGVLSRSSLCKWSLIPPGIVSQDDPPDDQPERHSSSAPVARCLRVLLEALAPLRVKAVRIRFKGAPTSVCSVTEILK